MKWITKRWHAISTCGRYEISARYTDEGFAWRGRLVQTDELIASSHDMEYVQHACALHAARLGSEAMPA